MSNKKMSCEFCKLMPGAKITVNISGSLVCGNCQTKVIKNSVVNTFYLGLYDHIHKFEIRDKIICPKCQECQETIYFACLDEIAPRA
jgi:hypothetical protein